MRDTFWFLVSYFRTLWLRRRFRDRAALEAWQERRVRAHVAWVRARSPFYRDLWQELPDAAWRRFPVIEKREMMTHFSRLNTLNVNREEAFAIATRAEETRDFTPRLGGVTVGLSSGTSGSRGLFLVSDEERNGWAGTMLAKILPRPLWRGARIAFFLRANSNLYQSVNKGKVRLSYFDMLQPLESHFSSLVELAPDVLIAPPQVLRRLADALLEGQLELKVEKIVSAAETLDPLDERVIMRAFGGASIHQGYQATEGFLGASCAHGTIHINEDLVHVEPQWLDEASGRFIPVVTDFRRRSQPIVRYRLGDILTQRRTPCPCGSPFRAIESIEGRCDDVFHLAAADGSSRWRAVFPDFVRRAVMTASDELERYLVEQESDGSVVVHLELSEPAPGQPARQGARDAVEASVRDNLAALCRLLDAKLPRLVFSSAIPPLGQRKLRRVVSRFRPENAAERA